jgi:hypothetical protein
MFTKGFGEVLADIMTVNPALSALPSASAILDASNYTFQAVTLGKDSDGFNHHAHTVYFTSGINGSVVNGVSSFNFDSSNDPAVILVNWASDAPSGVSSYVHSGVYSYFQDTYSSLPSYPSVEDTRLERLSTLVLGTSSFSGTSAIPDLGHYLNLSIDSNLSSVWNVYGGFPPHKDSNLPKLYYFEKDNEPTDNSLTGALYSVDLSGMFNRYGVMDKYGYLTISPSSVSQNVTQAGTDISVVVSGGAFLYSSTDFAFDDGKMKVSFVLERGDAACVTVFGGIRHVGIYCLDMKSLLASGLTPPYSWDALNNNRQYKLVAKATMWDNLMYNVDQTVNIGGTDYDQSALYHHLAQNIINDGSNSIAFSSGGPTISLGLDFK